MSSIINALEKLDYAVGKLDYSVSQAQEQRSEAPVLQDKEGNVVDVDFVARRLDKAIARVETILSEGA